jgi:hypothetical protein
MYWRVKVINILLYLDTFLFLVMVYDVGCLVAKTVEEDMRRAGLTINWDKSDVIPKHELLYLGFEVDLATSLFKVHIVSKMGSSPG